MRLIAILVLAFGAALAAGAIYFASEYFEQFQTARPTGPKLVNVIAAKTEIPYGTKISKDEHLRWVRVPEETMPKGAFTDADALLGPEGQRDDPDYTRYAIRSFSPNEVILDSRLTGFGEQQRMAMKLGEGRRAFTIQINAVSGVAGFVSPGDRVDIMLTRGSGETLESVVILSGVLIIAVDQKTNSRSNATYVGRTATLDVTVTEAQKLSLAQRVGKLSLSLRGYSEGAGLEDPSPSDQPSSVNLRDLFGDAEKKEASPSITLRKGGTISERVVIE